MSVQSYTFLYKKRLHENEIQKAKLLRKCQENHKAQVLKFICFTGQKSILIHSLQASLQRLKLFFDNPG